MNRRYLVSIHDVMPSTLPAVQELIDLLDQFGLSRLTLLVVPGAGWQDRDLEQLHAWQQRGIELAGHGWTHHAPAIRGWKHRLHSLTISRNAAEHLALSRPEVPRLMQQCHDWFHWRGLPAPELYVPPAWARGALHWSDLDSLPFRRVETLGGVYDRDQQRFHWLPMTGYEADTAFRTISVRLWNRMNLALGSDKRPIRLGIHPGDLTLRLADDLRALVREGGTALSYREIGD